MPRTLSLTAAAILLTMVASPAAAQEWRPAWHKMPTMPSMAELLDSAGGPLGGR